MNTQTTPITVQPIVGRYEKVNPANPGADFADLVIYVVATEKGTLRAVTSCGHLANYDRSTQTWGRRATVGDFMSITVDTLRGGYRRLGGWRPEQIVGVAVVDADGNATCEGTVPNRQIVRYFCD